MSFLGFKSLSEANVYATFVLLNMSIMMVVGSITSAPSFLAEYYKYATGDPDAVCEKSYFWDNSVTFFYAGSYVVQFICEIMTLTPLVRRVPLGIRLLIGLCIPFLEMLLMIVVPAVKIPTQDGAIAVVMTVSILGGFSNALCESTTNALVGPFPTKFMNGALWGLSVSPLFMSIIQLILQGSMSTEFNGVLLQSRIYFGIGMFVQAVTMFEFLILHKNPYAQEYTAEFRIQAQQRAAAKRVSEYDAPNTDGSDLVKDEDAAATRESHYNANAAVLRASGDADNMVDIDQVGNLTSSDQMLKASVLSVSKKVWPMLLCAFFVYFTTLFLFPGVFFKVHSDMSGSYPTIIVMLFNLTDFLSRTILMYRPLRPSPMLVLVGAFARLLIVPVLMLCCRHIIKGDAVPYVLIILHGLTNGYFGVMACIYCPRTPTLSRAGERSLAGILSNIFLMLGLCIGSNSALVLNLLI